MSPLSLSQFLLVLSIFTVTCRAQQRQECGAPPSHFRSRLPRQADRSASSAPPTVVPIVPYSSCGAVVVSDHFLLTAATCVLNNHVSSVRLGDLDLTQDGEVNSRPADYEIKYIYVHPNFSANSEGLSVHYSDLALLETFRPIQFNEAVFPYCLSQQRVTPGMTVIGSGFGYVNNTHRATQLQEAELDVMPLAQCEEMYRKANKLNQMRQAYPGLLQGSGVICAGHPERGACRGDEGGPLMYENNSGRRYLVGIMSFTDDDCRPGMLPSVSVSIADHFDYIMETIGSVRQ